MEYLKKVRDFLIDYYKKIAIVLAIACVVFSVLAVIPAATFDYNSWEIVDEQLHDAFGDVATEKAVAGMYGNDDKVEQLQEESEKILVLIFRNDSIKDDMQDTVRNWGIVAGVCAVGAISLFIYGKKVTESGNQPETTIDQED
ncbi:MAG: hypothetical protein IJP35_00320 [Clostridia bacterium]|nr:hypothetical protein [Clostridia bacterium]